MWASERVWTVWKKEYLLPVLGTDLGTSLTQQEARRYTDNVITDPSNVQVLLLN